MAGGVAQKTGGHFLSLRRRSGLSVRELARRTGHPISAFHKWERGLAVPDPAVLRILSSPQKQRGSTHFRFIDLFAGIGGIRKGFESIGGKCVFTSEWNKHCLETYRANFPTQEEIAGDITQVHAADIPAHDVLLAGFPCQPFSLAGVSKKNALKKPHGFECSTQGTLFFDIERIIRHHKPKAFMLENVKNLISHDKGRTFQVIKDVLENDLGYQIRFRVFSGSRWVPQKRERLIIVGFRDPNRFSLDDMTYPKKRPPTLADILHPEDGSENPEKHYTAGSKASVGEAYTLSAHLWNYLQEYARKHRAKGNGFGYGLFGPEDVARTLSARYHKDGSEILIKQRKGLRPRRLTPRECARLMGFDKPGESNFVIPVSDTQAYRQFGNSVVVPLIAAVARHMRPWLV